MIVYVHADDIFDRGLFFQRHEGLSDVVHLTIPRAYSVTQIVNTIIARVRNERSIYTMIWNGHGNRGHVGIGQGIGPYSGELAFLAPYMTPHGYGVEIHSCLVASATNDSQTADDGLGVETVRRFAYYLGCPVRAPMGCNTARKVVSSGWSASATPPASTRPPGSPPIPMVRSPSSRPAPGPDRSGRRMGGYSGAASRFGSSPGRSAAYSTAAASPFGVRAYTPLCTRSNQP